MTTSQPDATPAVATQSVRDALEKVLSSDAFQGSERSCTLLRFVVERTLNGQAENLKEYTLGTEALGRSSSFDPRTDAVVRSEVSRLRTRLEKYYATQGKSDAVGIALAKGSYVPRFERRLVVAGPPPASTVEPPVLVSQWRVSLVVAACILVGALAAIGYRELTLNALSNAKADRPLATEAATVSIAVLPFVNLSGDPGQDFFADGVTEELTTSLAALPNVLVVGRTSASQFKGERRDLRAIGQALNVTHLIEGSMRREGDRVRITAQLIRADSGVHLWSENYDRQFTGIVTLQEDVATAIAGALKLPLGLGSNQALASLQPRDAETYELFLRGRAAIRARNRTEEALNFLEQAVARDPNFAPAWRYLAQARNVDNIQRMTAGRELKKYPESRDTLARRVISLAPDSADGYAMLAELAQQEHQRLETLRLLEQALERDRNDPEVLNGYANALWELGYLKEAVAVRERQHVLEPLVPIYNFLRAETLAANGQVEQALHDWLAVAPKNSAGHPFGLRVILPALVQLGRYDEAIARLSNDTGERGPVLGPLDREQAEAAANVLRAVANKSPPPTRLPDFDDELGFIYVYTAPERILDHVESDIKSGHASLRYVWWPTPSSLRKTERFKTLMREAGFVDIWRMRGWPDLCRPVGTGDFECD